MRPSVFRLSHFALVCSFFLLFPAWLWGQASTQPLIQNPVDENQLTLLKGSTYPLARAEFDRGPAPPDLPMHRILLVLKRSPEQKAALSKLLDEQQDKSSPDYHNWLTPEQFGREFGPADLDIQQVTTWLQSHGFQVAQASKGRTVIEFSGTAAQVQEAFHTAIHKYVVKGEEHWANASDPQIPTALTPVVAGVHSLHNFYKKPMIHVGPRVPAIFIKGSPPQVTFPAQNGQPTTHALGPRDYATIYNINPVYQSGINGNGVNIGVVGRSNINLFDVSDFEGAFGIAPNSPTLVVEGPDPGDLGGDEEAEAVLDTTWSSALAPGARVFLVVSASTNTTDGADLSEVYIIDNNLADIMTESFSSCESPQISTEMAAHGTLAEQAAAQGITYLVSTGDTGAEGCDNLSEQVATGPVAVNYLAATPFNVAVGGTIFNEGTQSSKYWTSLAPLAETALSYIPEDVWNESCIASQCGSQSANIAAGGGGASAFFLAKPSWQSGVNGIPNDGARDLPDVSLTAALHDPYLLCLDGSCEQDFIFFVGGTSASTPSFAGIMALVLDKVSQGSNPPPSPRQGQANYVLYRLAAAENLAQCNGSNSTNLPASNCIFNDVTVGNDAVPGEAGYGAPGAKYQAGAGYDLATGLGSVNAANLVNEWDAVTFRATTTTVTPSSITATHGSPVSLDVSVTPNSGTGTPTGDVSLQTSLIVAPGFIDAFPPAEAGFITLNNGSTSSMVNDLPGGTYTLTAQYAGDATFAPSPPSAPINVTISPETSSTTLTLLTADQSGNLIPFSGGPFGGFVYVRADVSAQSGHSIPTGSVAFADNGNSFGALNLNSQGNTSTPNGYFGFSAGQHSLVAQYRGDNSFNVSSSSPAARFAITQASTSTALTPISGAVQGNTVTLTANIASSAFAGAPFNFCNNMPCESPTNFPSGTVTFFAGSSQLGSTQVSSYQVGANGVSATTSLNTSALPPGQDSITAQYGGDSNYTASTSAPMTVNVQADFSLSTGAPSVTIPVPGGSGTVTLSINGQTGYNGTINFTSASCSGLPRESACSFNPTTVSGSGQTVVTISTKAPQVVALRGMERWTGSFGFISGVVFLLGVPRKRRRWGRRLPIVALIFLLGALGCGGGGNGSSGGGGDPGTPLGTTTVTVTATPTGGALTHTTTFQLTVQ